MAATGDVPQTQRERLAFLELRAFFTGELRRGDTEARFGVKPAAASRDLSSYRDIAPGNLDYDVASRCFRPSPTFNYAHCTTPILDASLLLIEPKVAAAYAAKLAQEAADREAEAKDKESGGGGAAGGSKGEYAGGSSTTSTTAGGGASSGKGGGSTGAGKRTEMSIPKAWTTKAAAAFGPRDLERWRVFQATA